MRHRVRPLLPGAGVLVFVSLLAGAALADTVTPILAFGFENPDAVKRVFGTAGTPVPGRQGQGLTGANLTVGNPATAERGTLMAWLKLEERNPLGGFQCRWVRFGGGQLGPMGGSHRPGWLGVNGDKESVLIEPGDWHHWGCVWNGTKRQLYLDGRLVIEGEQATPYAAPPAIHLVPAEGGNRWVVDDVKIYAEALTSAEMIFARDQVVTNDLAPGLTPPSGQPVETLAAAPVPAPVPYDERQLVENPGFAPGRNEFAAGLIPQGWSLGAGQDVVKTDANGVSCAVAGNQQVSLMATLKRGMVAPGRVYQIGAYCRLKRSGGRALLRFRNQIDMGSLEFALPEGEWQRVFFLAKAPEDYDVGIYYLEVFIEGAGTEFGLRGVYCREATPEEVRKANLTVTAAAVPLPPTVEPDERWIEDLPAGRRFLKPADRQAAWSNGTVGLVLKETIRQEGNALWFEQGPRELWDRLVKLQAASTGAVLRLAVTRAQSPVPGGAGLDSLPPRSVHAAALLFGIGAVDTGIGSHALQRLRGMLETFGYFEPSTVFLPFWDQKGFYKRRYETRTDPVDYRELYNQPVAARLKDDDSIVDDLLAADTPLFGHTATGVLVSGYRHGNQLLLVVVNTTDQELGKLGNLWVDHARVFGMKASDTGRLMKSDVITATDVETGAKGNTSWNRTGGGYLADIWFNIAIAPGDYRLILVEYRK